MLDAVSDPDNPTLHELKQRGARAAADIAEACRQLRKTVAILEELRGHIRAHHAPAPTMTD